MTTEILNKTAILENIDANVKPVKIARAPRDANGNVICYTLDETIDMMYDILSEHYGFDLRQNPSAGTIDEQSRAEQHPFLEFVPHKNDRINNIPRDADGNIIGYTWEETREMMYGILAEHYGADVRTV
jgi:hypothetical protein